MLVVITFMIPPRLDGGHGPMNRRRFLATAALATGALAGFPAWAQEESLTEASLSFGTPTDRVMPRDYLGLSYETVQLADPSFFAADNRELVSLFKALSPNGVLRLGGNSSEFCWWKAGAADNPRSAGVCSPRGQLDATLVHGDRAGCH